MLKIAHQGQLLIGDMVFTAQQDVTESLPTGGPWVPGRYTVAGLPVVAELTTIIIDTAANTEFYSCKLRGQNFIFTSDGSATLLEIRDGLKALVDASSLTITTATVGGDAFSVQADVAGEGLKLSVLAETPVNMSISARTSVPALLGVISRDSGEITVRSPTSITARVGLMVAA